MLQVQDNDIWLGKQSVKWLEEMHDTLQRANGAYQLAKNVAEECEHYEELKSYSRQIRYSSNEEEYLKYKIHI